MFIDIDGLRKKLKESKISINKSVMFCPKILCGWMEEEYNIKFIDGKHETPSMIYYESKPLYEYIN